MMESFVRTLLEASLTGGVFILAAVLVRSGVRHRLPKHFLVLLWAAVLLRLLTFFEMPSPTSLYNYVVLRGSVVSESTVTPAPPPASGIGRMTLPGPPAGAAAGPGAAENGGMSLRRLFYVWASGAAVFFLLFAGGYAATMRRFDSAFLLKDNPAVNNWLKGRKNPPRVLVSDRTATPLSYGLLRPRIVLPADFDFSDSRRVESVLEHEYVHGSNYHNIMKSMVYLSLVLHWFNPLVWLYWLLFNHDLELACDERVIGVIGRERRAEYAHSLVAVAERAVIPFPLVSAFSARSLKERIVDVMGYKRTTASLLAAEALLAAGLFALFGTTAVIGGSRDAPFTAGTDASSPAGAAGFPGWPYPEGMEPAAAALAFTGGVVIKQEVDTDDGRTEHEFVIISGDREYMLKIDPRARSLVEFEQKDAKKHFAGVDFSRFMSMDEALRAAREAAPGGTVSECELKRDKQGRFVYVAEISGGGRKREVVIDAAAARTAPAEK